MKDCRKYLWIVKGFKHFWKVNPNKHLLCRATQESDTQTGSTRTCVYFRHFKVLQELHCEVATFTDFTLYYRGKQTSALLDLLCNFIRYPPPTKYLPMTPSSKGLTFRFFEGGDCEHTLSPGIGFQYQKWTELTVLSYKYSWSALFISVAYFRWQNSFWCFYFFFNKKMGVRNHCWCSAN